MSSHVFTRKWGAVIILVLAPFLTHCGQGVEFAPGERPLGLEAPEGSLGDDLGQDPDAGLNQPQDPGLLRKFQRVEVEAKGARDIDILFVVDNSGSMRPFQHNMATRIEGFMAHVQGLNYHIAVTSTDPRPGAKWGDGQFRQFDSDRGPSVLRASEVTNLREAEGQLGQAIQMGIDGSGDERGIYNTYRAIERRSSEVDQASFFREHAALSVVLISDEDECSRGHRECRGQDPQKSDPHNLLKLVTKEFGDNKRFIYNSIIFPPGQACEGGAFPGHSYLALSQMTGGAVGSVCADNYAQQLSSIGRLSRLLVQSVRLDCEPQDTTGDGRPNLTIYDSGNQVVRQDFTINGRNVTLEQGLEDGEYIFSYSCKAEQN